MSGALIYAGQIVLIRRTFYGPIFSLLSVKLFADSPTRAFRGRVTVENVVLLLADRLAIVH